MEPAITNLYDFTILLLYFLKKLFKSCSTTVAGNGLGPLESGATPLFLCDSAQLDVHDNFFGDRMLDSGWVMVDDNNSRFRIGVQNGRQLKSWRSKMGNNSDTVRVNVTLAVSGEALQTIVRTAKEIVGRNEKGHFRIDTADLLEDLLSNFIDENGFDAYVADRENYGFLNRQ